MQIYTIYIDIDTYIDNKHIYHISKYINIMTCIRNWDIPPPMMPMESEDQKVSMDWASCPGSPEIPLLARQIWRQICRLISIFG